MSEERLRAEVKMLDGKLARALMDEAHEQAMGIEGALAHLRLFKRLGDEEAECKHQRHRAVRAEQEADKLHERLADQPRRDAEKYGQMQAYLYKVMEHAQALFEALGAAEADRDAWKRDSLMWSKAWERELDGYYVHKTHRIDAAVMSTRKLVERLKTCQQERDEVHRQNKALREQLAPGGQL